MSSLLLTGISEKNGKHIKKKKKKNKNARLGVCLRALRASPCSGKKGPVCRLVAKKERPFVFMAPVFCFITINIALDVYESYHPLVKNGGRVKPLDV